MIAERRALWREALGALGLVPTRSERGGLVYLHTWQPLQLEVTVGLLHPELPIEIRVLGPRQPEEFLLVPLAQALHSPALTTSDPAFDASVAIALGDALLLANLGRDERESVRQAIELGAQLDATGALLPAHASQKLASVAEIREAIERMGRAVLALRVPHLDEMLQRSLKGPDTPEVDRALRARVDIAVPVLPPHLLGPVARLVLRDVPDQELPAALLDRAMTLWGLHHRAGVADILCEALRAHGPGQAFHQLWNRRNVRLDAVAGARVLQTLLELDMRRWAQLVMRVSPLPSTRIRTGARLRLRGQEVILLAVVVRGRADWVDLLLALHAHSAPDAQSLSELLVWLDHPNVPFRLLELLELHPEAVAGPLSQRVLRALRQEHLGELASVLNPLDDRLLDALLSLPDEALGWLVKLNPRSEEQRLRWIERLSRSPGPETERALIPWLEQGPLRVRRAAAQALGTTGAAAALEALDAVVRGWLVDGDLRAAALASIAAIRARHAQGGLSLAVEEGGKLSITGSRGP